MTKRKRGCSLAEDVLAEKLKAVHKNLTEARVAETSNVHSRGFPQLLQVCLDYEQIKSLDESQRASHNASSVDCAAAERLGDYNYEALQREPIDQGIHHAPFVGPIKVSSLPSPKDQGVVASRDVLKGQLLCSSVPTIVVPNLVSVDEDADLLFSDLSRAEMTAKLILMARESEDVRKALQAFEYAGKEQDHRDDIDKTCEEIIPKYTWAIDHPSTDPRGRPLKGRYTKVAGHAFTVSGYAGKFNHSCVPNATMVSYGAIQFFRANCAVAEGTEICVSYGYDPLDSVSERRRKLRLHADFACLCPLCLFQLDAISSSSSSSSSSTRPAARESGDGQRRDATIFRDFGTLLHHILRVGHGQHNASSFRGLYDETVSQSQAESAMMATGSLLDDDDDDDDDSIVTFYKDINILRFLELYPLLLKDCEHEIVEKGGGGGWKGGDSDAARAVVSHCLLVSVMLLALQVPRPRDVGIVFGDMYRLQIGILADKIDLLDGQVSIGTRTGAYMTAAWWRQKSLEYTDLF